MRNQPLIYVTLWNTVLYSVAAFVLHNLEHLISAMRHLHLGFFEAGRQVFLTMADMRTWVIMMWVIAFTFVFCVLRELIHAIGRERFWNMFLGLPHPPHKGTEDIRRAG